MTLSTTSISKNFLSLPAEILGIIAEKLSMKDIRSLGLMCKSIHNNLEDIMPMAQRKVVYLKSRIEMVRFLVPTKTLKGIDLDIPDEDRSYLQHVKLMNILDATINCDPSTRFGDIGNEDLAAALKNAAWQGHVDIVKAFINCSRFAHISYWSLRTALVGAAGRGRIDVVNALIECRRFGDIGNEDLAAALKNAAWQGSVDIVKALIRCDRFMNIHINNLGNALTKASIQGHIDIVKALIACSRFGEFLADDLGLALENASKKGHINIVKTLMACSRFGEFPAAKLGLALKNAAFKGYIEIFDTLIECNRFDEIGGFDALQALCTVAVKHRTVYWRILAFKIASVLAKI